MSESARLSHVDDQQRPQMVDVGAKAVTRRSAHARARVRLPATVAAQLRQNDYITPKGAVLTVAQLAGVMGAKATAQLIPLCHPLPLERCDVTLRVENDDVLVDCTVACEARTGVEMEALTGASVAALALYDMCKALSHDIVIADIALVSKTGGKRDFQRNEAPPDLGGVDPHALDAIPSTHE